MNIEERHISLFISFVAVLISAVVAIIQFREINDVRVNFFINSHPTLGVKDGTYKIENFEVVFAISNSGNQPVILQRIDWLIMNTDAINPDSRVLERCGEGVGGVISQGQVTPILIEPGKIAPITVEFPKIEKFQDGASQSDYVASCFNFILVHSDASISCPSIPALRFSSSGGGGSKNEYEVLYKESCDG